WGGRKGGGAGPAQRGAAPGGASRRRAGLRRRDHGPLDVLAGQGTPALPASLLAGAASGQCERRSPGEEAARTDRRPAARPTTSIRQGRQGQERRPPDRQPVLVAPVLGDVFRFFAFAAAQIASSKQKRKSETRPLAPTAAKA